MDPAAGADWRSCHRALHKDPTKTHKDYTREENPLSGLCVSAHAPQPPPERLRQVPPFERRQPATAYVRAGKIPFPQPLASSWGNTPG